MSQYPFKEIEEKWQQQWEDSGAHKIDLTKSENKFYSLTMFSYPSGDKLHTGHWYNYGPADSYARYKKMKGFNVFQPQGFDSFGLPAENYAIKHGVHPAKSTAYNIIKMRQQLRKIGAMYDWSQEVVTSTPEYYKWTQWLFLKLYEMGLAEQRKAPVNWCNSCATVLANEQVKNGECDRCSHLVTKKDLTQWFFKITEYSEELLEKLDDLNWPEKTKLMQKHWIGKSIGAEIIFKVKDIEDQIEVFTTRPDTIYGATYMVLAPEHPLVEKITTQSQKLSIDDYISESKKKSEIDRMSTEKIKTGVFTGSYAINPISKEEIPIWIGDYVLASYGTGAIMAVPSGDERDFEFAQKFNLPIIEVVSPDGKLHGNDCCFSEHGISVNSGEFNGMKSAYVIDKVTENLSQNKLGKKKVQYKLHDWLISRQRYWGTPIPIIYCDSCGSVPVPQNELPVLLPEDIELSSTYGEDIAPLATHETFINTNCPKCSKPAKRDADTMDTFVCSSWYYLRYPNAKLKNNPFSPERMSWLPVDQYIGGSEHATMHLLYARFITKALRDGGLLNFDEPFLNLYHQGIITKDGSKMSKSKGNTVSPDEFVDKYGSDTFRAFLMFMGPFDEGGDWNDKGITGIHRFLNKIWRLIQLAVSNNKPSKADLRILHYTIKVMGEDIEQKKFNTAISRAMEFVNHFTSRDEFPYEFKTLFLKLIAPLVPHISEELWHIIGNSSSIFDHDYPQHNPVLLKVEEIKFVIQINGKLRGDITVDKSTEKNDILILAKENSNVKKYLVEKIIVKEILVPNKLINFVVR
jgi:leucyl-tRNA synthetase